VHTSIHYCFRSAILMTILSGLTITNGFSQESEGTQPAPISTYTILTEGPIEVPFEIYHGDIRFQCEINGVEVYMLLDDGFMWDELLFWGPQVDELDLNYTGELGPIGSPGDKTSGPPSKTADGITVRFAGVEFTDEKAIVSPPGSWYQRAFVGSEGQFSGTFFKNFTVDINFDEMVITLIEPDEFSYMGSGKAVEWTPSGFGPRQIPVVFGLEGDRTVEMNVLMDLGYNNQFQIVTGGEHGFAMPGKTLIEKIDRGVGPTETFYQGRLPAVSIGGYELTDVLVALLPEDHSSMVFSEVMMGLNFLTRFNVVYDYHHNRIYLEPNKKFNTPFEYDMSGFVFRTLPDGELEIKEVHPDSPAAEAGLAVGDIITQINGKPSADYSRFDLRAMFKNKGETIALHIRTGGETREVGLKLKRVI